MYYNYAKMPYASENMVYNTPCDKCNIPQKDYSYASKKSYHEIMKPEFTHPFMMGKEKSKVCVKVPEVVGKNCCEILLETEIPFDPRYPAMEIKDIIKDVNDLKLSVCTDKVLVNGVLHKNINYKTYEADKKVQCNCNDIQLVYGDLKHVSVNIPFSCYINIPGARNDDMVEVEYAGVDNGCELDILKHPCFIRGCKVPVYKKLKEKVIVKVEVKVLRPVQITVSPESCNICP